MTLVIAGKELRNLFLSPFAWCLMAVSLLLLAWLFLLRIEDFLNLQPRLAALHEAPGVTALIVVPQFDTAAVILMLLVPLLGMGLFSREFSNGTFSLLLSAPVSTARIVLGKYLAMMTLLSLLLLLFLLMPLSVLTMGSSIDMGTLAACTLGLFLAVALYAAVGLYFSSLTRQPAVAAVSSYGVLLLLWVIDLAGGDRLSHLGLSNHLHRLFSGLIVTSDVVYFILVTGLFLTLTIKRLETLRTSPPSTLIKLSFYPLLVFAVISIGMLNVRHTQVWDWSDAARNSLTQTSLRLLEKLEAPLKITSFTPDDTRMRQRIRVIIDRYRRNRPDIIFEFVDPARQPALIRELGIKMSGELRLEYQGRSELLQKIDEQSLADAIQRLLAGGDRWIVNLTGHGERQLDGKANYDLGQFGDHLKRKGYQVQALNLSANPQLPTNTSLLAIASPQHAYLRNETRILSDYLEQGGNLLWLLDPGESNRLEPLAMAMGLLTLPGVIVDTHSATLGLDDPTLALVTEYSKHPATAQFELVTLYPQAMALDTIETGEWKVTPLLTTQTNSWNETGPVFGEVSRDPEAGEIRGPLSIALVFTREWEDRQQRVVVIGDGDFISNSFLGNGGNLDLGLNLVRWLVRDEHLINIPPRVANDRKLDLSPSRGATIGLIFLLVLPLSLLMTGALIWWYRRRL
ncbi:MAG: ABC transporter permease subunit [Gammaproteobacteria bacterium]|nr:ABC transporter permease subunit [Gammaproteobacteria bacterium]